MVMYFTKNEIYISYIQSFLTNVHVSHKLINIQNTSITSKFPCSLFQSVFCRNPTPSVQPTDLILTTKWTQIHFSYCRRYTNEIVPFVLFCVRPHEGRLSLRERVWRVNPMLRVAHINHSPASMDEKCILLHKNKPTGSLYVFYCGLTLLLTWNYSAYRSYESSRLQFCGCFTSVGLISRSGITGLWDRCIFTFLRSFQCSVIVPFC